MKQFQTEFDNEEHFSEWLAEMDSDIRKYSAVFHIYTNTSQYEYAAPAVRLIKERFPGVPYAGAVCCGAIHHGVSAVNRVFVMATIFECADSRAEVVQLTLTHETQDATARTLLDMARERPWIKAIEVLTTIGNVDMPRFCKAISALPEDILFYGGGVTAADVPNGNSEKNFVFSSAGEPAFGSAVFVLQGGSQLHAHAQYLTGWRKLGLPFEITEAHHNVIKSLNGKPALEQYERYLQLPLDENYFDLAIVFPFCSELDGTPYLRVSTNHLEDGSMVMSADVEEHAVVHIAYGDPANMRASVNESLVEVQAFQPQIIQLFSCVSRQLFWGVDVDSETQPFDQVAPVSGFYTAGEFLRAKRNVILHNMAMTIVSFREGSSTVKPDQPVIRMKDEGFSRPIMINNCLTTFINAATEELRRANEKLAYMAVTDGLTGLLNRAEIERLIRKALALYLKAPREGQAPVVAMMDLDFFKKINDTFGHQEGDEVLKDVSALFRKAVNRKGISASVGRWGGEEFMFLIEGMDLQAASQFAEEIRIAASEIRFDISGIHTLSAGVTRATIRDTVDTLTERADKGLYMAKEHGRNQSTVVSIM